MGFHFDIIILNCFFLSFHALPHYPLSCLLGGFCKDSTFVRAPVKDDSKECGWSYKDLEVVPVHQIMAYLFDTVGLKIDMEDVREFWRFSREEVCEPWALYSPATERHIPLGLYGDSAKVETEFGSYKVLGVFANLPLFRPSRTRYSRWLLFSIREEEVLAPWTMNEIYRHIVWSCNILFHGLHPSRGIDGQALSGKHVGKPICSGGQVFTVTELRGDWAYHKQTFRFKASWTGHDICFKCPARRAKALPEDLYQNVQADAKWLQEEFDTAGFLRERLPGDDPCCLADATCSAFWLRWSAAAHCIC